MLTSSAIQSPKVFHIFQKANVKKSKPKMLKTNIADKQVNSKTTGEIPYIEPECV